MNPLFRVYYKAMRMIDSPNARDWVSERIARRRGGSGRKDNPLSETGLVRLPDLLGPDQVQEILTWFAGKPVHNPYTKSAEFDPATNPAGERVGNFRFEHVYQAPHLLRLANHPDVLDLMERHLGAPPIITALEAWWSYPTGKQASNSQLYHRDRDDWRFGKLFVYLTDVDETAGPHVYVKGSNRGPHLNTIRRLNDEEVLAAFPQDAIVTLTGPAGSAFAEDTSGIHRGVPPTGKRRLVFEAEYGLTGWSAFPIRRMPPPAFRIDPWVNRLITAA